MNRILSCSFLIAILAGTTAVAMQSTQVKPYKVAFDLTSADPH